LQALQDQEFIVNLDTADVRAWDELQAQESGARGHLYKDMIMYPREVGVAWKTSAQSKDKYAV
jgi:hypothetical protein